MNDYTFEKNGFTYSIKFVPDLDPDISYLETADTPEERANNEKRMETFEDTWYLGGVTVDISKQTGTNWAIPTVVGRASLWGIESDSGDDYFEEIINDQITEAEHDLENLKTALEVN